MIRGKAACSGVRFWYIKSLVWKQLQVVPFDHSRNENNTSRLFYQIILAFFSLFLFFFNSTYGILELKYKYAFSYVSCLKSQQKIVIRKVYSFQHYLFSDVLFNIIKSVHQQQWWNNNIENVFFWDYGFFSFKGGSFFVVLEASCF